MQSFEYFCRIPTESEKYISRCITLAKKGLGQVSPNPLVGCVIVHNGRIISESYHKIYGGPHAEVNAINALDDHEILKDCTVYVNLEPCAHYGKTPPCAQLLIEKQVKKVVIGMQDPYPEVAGKGIQMLKQAGIKVEVGVLEKNCQEVNKRFLCNLNHQRPYVILKWAESADGFIGQSKPIQISGEKARQIVHEWRTQEDAFLVGTNTLLIDNPQLNVRFAKGRNPIRIALDFHLKSEAQQLHFKDNSQRSLILNGIKNEISGQLEYQLINNTQVSTILKKLWELKIGSIVVEGGAAILNSFIQSGLYDEIKIFKSKQLQLNNGVKAPFIETDPKSELDLGDDILISY